MRKTILALAATTLLGGLALGAGPASAAMGPDGLRAPGPATYVMMRKGMTHRKMMMRKGMNKKMMMKRGMMKKKMM